MRVRSWGFGPASRVTWRKSEQELRFPAHARGANKYRMILAYEEPFVLVVQSCVDMTQSTPKVKPCWYLDGKDVLARGEVLPRSVQAALEGQSSRFLTRIGNDAGFKEDWMPTAARQYCSQFLSPAGAGVLLSPPPLRTDEREALSQPGSRQRQFTEFALGELLPPGA